MAINSTYPLTQHRLPRNQQQNFPLPAPLPLEYKRVHICIDNPNPHKYFIFICFEIGHGMYFVSLFKVISTQMGSTNWWSPIWPTPNTIRRYTRHSVRGRALSVYGMWIILHLRVWTLFLLFLIGSATAQSVFSPSKAETGSSSLPSPVPPSCTPIPNPATHNNGAAWSTAAPPPSQQSPNILPQ